MKNPAVQSILKGQSAARQTPTFRSVGASVGGFGVLNTARAHQDVASDVSFLSSSLDSLRSRSAFGDVQTEIVNLDRAFNELMQTLESVRSKGYCFQGDLETQANQANGRWEGMRDRVIATADQQAASFQTRLPALTPQIDRLNAVLHSPTTAKALLTSTRTQVDGMLNEVDRIHRSLRDQYGPIETQINELTTRLTHIQWGLDQLPEARFAMEKGEDLVMAVKARWDKEGKEDPEGVLYLTNKRLIFERKEKVATKKVLFITTASELVHEVVIDRPLSVVTGVKAESKGLFGHQDFMAVQFSDAKLGAASFHLQGQDDKMWVDLVNNARSGRLERAVSTGVSAADMSRSISNADVLALQGEVNQLQDEMMLQQARQDLIELESDVHSLSRRLSSLRSRGYAIEKDLEASIELLVTQWSRIKGVADTAIDQQTRLLGDQMRSVQQQLSQLMGISASGNQAQTRALYLEVKSSVAASASQAEAACVTVESLYEKYRTEVETLSAHLDWVGWMLDALATASFQLSASEYGIAAVEAVWQYPGLEPENGILYLTGQRLIWEDRVGTYELKVNVPLQLVGEVTRQAEASATDEADVQEKLVFSFASGASLSSSAFLLSMPVADDWIKMVGRARSGGYENELAIKVDPTEMERIRNAPTQCPACNAAFGTPVMRGQTEISCDYCGVKSRF